LAQQYRGGQSPPLSFSIPKFPKTSPKTGLTDNLSRLVYIYGDDKAGKNLLVEKEQCRTANYLQIFRGRRVILAQL
jgi:hypothetical protein